MLISLCLCIMCLFKIFEYSFLCVSESYWRLVFHFCNEAPFHVLSFLEKQILICVYFHNKTYFYFLQVIFTSKTDSKLPKDTSKSWTISNFQPETRLPIVDLWNGRIRCQLAKPPKTFCSNNTNVNSKKTENFSKNCGGRNTVTERPSSNVWPEREWVEPGPTWTWVILTRLGIWWFRRKDWSRKCVMKCPMSLGEQE